MVNAPNAIQDVLNVHHEKFVLNATMVYYLSIINAQKGAVFHATDALKREIDVHHVMTAMF